MATWVRRSLALCVLAVLAAGAGAGCGGSNEIPLATEGLNKLPPPPKPVDDKAAQQVPREFQGVIKNSSGNSKMSPGRGR